MRRGRVGPQGYAVELREARTAVLWGGGTGVRQPEAFRLKVTLRKDYEKYSTVVHSSSLLYCSTVCSSSRLVWYAFLSEMHEFGAMQTASRRKPSDTIDICSDATTLHVNTVL